MWTLRSRISLTTSEGKVTWNSGLRSNLTYDFRFCEHSLMLSCFVSSCPSSKGKGYHCPWTNITPRWHRICLACWKWYLSSVFWDSGQAFQCCFLDAEVWQDLGLWKEVLLRGHWLMFQRFQAIKDDWLYSMLWRSDLVKHCEPECRTSEVWSLCDLLETYVNLDVPLCHFLFWVNIQLGDCLQEARLQTPKHDLTEHP